MRAGQRDGVDTSALVGDATAFFSYSWTGTKLGDMLDAVERGIQRLEAEAGGEGRVLVWIDMFCASQNLLGGVYRDDANHPKGSPGYKARKEDTDNIFGDALKAVNELLLYSSPLLEEWTAPPHKFLLPERGEPPKGWVRRGPGAITRAWCLFEVSEALAGGCRLHVVLNQKDTEGFRGVLTTRYDEVANLLACVDARDAQISKVEDRDYILGEVAKLDGGVGYVTSVVLAALRGWLQAEARRCLDAMDKAERGTSRLIDRVASLLKAQGKLGEAEPLYREALAARRETLGDRHPDTLASINNMAALLKALGKPGEAETLLNS